VGGHDVVGLLLLAELVALVERFGFCGLTNQ
jgi:hypothetical protein